MAIQKHPPCTQPCHRKHPTPVTTRGIVSHLQYSDGEAGVAGRGSWGGVVGAGKTRRHGARGSKTGTGRGQKKRNTGCAPPPPAMPPRAPSPAAHHGNAHHYSFSSMLARVRTCTGGHGRPRRAGRKRGARGVPPGPTPPSSLRGLGQGWPVKSTRLAPNLAIENTPPQPQHGA